MILARKEIRVQEWLTKASPSLPRWLIEPCPHVILPVLPKMAIWNNVVMLHHGSPPETDTEPDQQIENTLHKSTKMIANE